MYVAGAEKLRGFWEKHPLAEGPLSALLAFLSEGTWSRSQDLIAALGDVATENDGAIAVELLWCAARVHLRCNCAASVVLIDRVSRSEG